MIYVAKIVHSTSVDGVGLRNSLYVSGCNIKCPGCHNKAYWELSSGEPMSVENVYNLLNEDYFNMSILVGEPLLQYAAGLKLCEMLKFRSLMKTISLWS